MRNLRPKLNRRSGLSLIEVILSTILVSFLMVASLRTTANVFLTWSTAAEQADAQRICQLLMTEVLQKNYQDPEEPGETLGVNTGESSTDRTTFDDIDDFDGYSASPPRDHNNLEIPGFTGWSQSVVVRKLAKGNASVVRNNSNPDEGVRRITVTITSPSNLTSTLVGVRCAYGQNEQQRGVDGTHVVWVGTTLGTGGNMSRNGTQIPNHATD